MSFSGQPDALPPAAAAGAAAPTGMPSLYGDSLPSMSAVAPAQSPAAPPATAAAAAAAATATTAGGSSPTPLSKPPAAAPPSERMPTTSSATTATATATATATTDSSFYPPDAPDSAAASTTLASTSPPTSAPAATAAAAPPPATAASTTTPSAHAAMLPALSFMDLAKIPKPPGRPRSMHSRTAVTQFARTALALAQLSSAGANPLSRYARPKNKKRSSSARDGSLGNAADHERYNDHGKGTPDPGTSYALRKRRKRKILADRFVDVDEIDFDEVEQDEVEQDEEEEEEEEEEEDGVPDLGHGQGRWNRPHMGFGNPRGLVDDFGDEAFDDVDGDGYGYDGDGVPEFAPTAAVGRARSVYNSQWLPDGSRHRLAGGQLLAGDASGGSSIAQVSEAYRAGMQEALRRLGVVAAANPAASRWGAESMLGTRGSPWLRPRPQGLDDYSMETREAAARLAEEEEVAMAQRAQFMAYGLQPPGLGYSRTLATPMFTAHELLGGHLRGRVANMSWSRQLQNEMLECPVPSQLAQHMPDGRRHYMDGLVSGRYASSANLDFNEVWLAPRGSGRSAAAAASVGNGDDDDNDDDESSSMSSKAFPAGWARASAGNLAGGVASAVAGRPPSASSAPFAASVHGAMGATDLGQKKSKKKKKKKRSSRSGGGGGGGGGGGSGERADFVEGQVRLSRGRAAMAAAMAGAEGGAEGGDPETLPCMVGNCAQAFTDEEALREHLRGHLRKRPFACNWPGCEWSFSRSDELRRHSRTHTGERPLRCDECGRRFSRADHLNKHRQRHLGASLSRGELTNLVQQAMSAKAAKPAPRPQDQLDSPAAAAAAAPAAAAAAAGDGDGPRASVVPAHDEGEDEDEDVGEGEDEDEDEDEDEIVM